MTWSGNCFCACESCLDICSFPAFCERSTNILCSFRVFFSRHTPPCLMCCLLWRLSVFSLHPFVSQVFHLHLPVTNVEVGDQPGEELLKVTGRGRGGAWLSCAGLCLMRLTVPSRHSEWPGLWLRWARPRRPSCTSVWAPADLCCSHHGSTKRQIWWAAHQGD